MSKTPDDISQSIRTKLATTAPALSCDLGTPERKIIDACSEAISEAYIDQYLTGSLLDVETKSGMELDQYVGIFGFGRLQGRQAVGVVRLTLTTAASQDQNIALGTQFYTQPGLASVANQLFYASTQPVVLVAGNYSVDVPVQCTTVGSVGNVPPDSITSVSSVVGSASSTNLTAMTGGVDTETDDELRTRFKNTLLRNIAGTSDYYVGLCLANNNVSRATVFGPTTLYRTQIVVPSTTLTVPVNQDVKYVWPSSSSVFTNLGQEDETFFNEIDDYTLSTGASPIFTKVGSALTTSDIVNLEFEYTTQSSRNDPANNIFNKVDIYCDGTDPIVVTERTVVVSTTLSTSPSNVLYTGNFERFGTTGTPSSSNRFMRLASVPLVTFPSTITVGATVYTQGTHYHVLVGKTLLRGSAYEVAGIEWLGSGPSNGTQLTLTYTYNRMPVMLQAVMRQSKQITTDVMVHQAKYQYIKPNLCIQYDRSIAIDQTNSSISTTLKQYYSLLPFGSQMRIVDLLVQVRQLVGVVNVSLATTADDASHYGIEVYDNATDPTPAVVDTTDFKLDDNVLAIYLDVHIQRKASP